MLEKNKAERLRKIIKLLKLERKIAVYELHDSGKTVVRRRFDVGCNDFLLKGKYDYEQVKKLNDLIGYSAGFGYCEEIGSVAFIGVPNYMCVQNDGYFNAEVTSYGKCIHGKAKKFYFRQYPDEIAQNIKDYTVYGLYDPRIFSNLIQDGTIKLDELEYIYDYRYESKDESGYYTDDDIHHDFVPSVLNMDIELGGTYSFYEARMFAYGSTEECKCISGHNVPIQFAMVGDKPIGILDLWHHYDGVLFREVWEKDKEEPEAKPIRFLSDEEAQKITNFKLYYYIAPFGTIYRKSDEKIYIIEKIDRTLVQGFDFTTEDGSDYRLKSPVENKELIKERK